MCSKFQVEVRITTSIKIARPKLFFNHWHQWKVLRQRAVSKNRSAGIIMSRVNHVEFYGMSPLLFWKRSPEWRRDHEADNVSSSDFFETGIPAVSWKACCLFVCLLGIFFQSQNETSNLSPEVPSILAAYNLYSTCCRCVLFFSSGNLNVAPIMVPCCCC